MGYQNAMKALNLDMPMKIPRTEFSASFHWPLVERVTGIKITNSSDEREKLRAVKVFESAWDFGFTWSILTSAKDLTGPKTNMGHAVYQMDGVDFDDNITCPFPDADSVLSYDPFKANGFRDKGDFPV